MGKRYSKQMQGGQAMVEFALTSLLFILLVVSIIEIARIMHAYVTIQHAARVGGRYAVTGQWMPEYAGNPAAHYDPNSGEPYARIYPCWPRFPDDPMPKAQTPDGPTYYEPFRGPRTCSIEKQVLQQMRPLGLVPDADFHQPGHYQVVVSSSAPDSTPTIGEFTRNGETLQYANYYDNENPTAEVVRGYAGKPNGQVIVQVRYNIRLVTPLLSNIVPYIPLQARVVMTNEAFGSTSVLTEAAPAPNMQPVGPLHVPIAPDLRIVPEKTVNENGNTNPNINDSIVYKIAVTNDGELNAVKSFKTCLYASRDDSLTGSQLRNPSVLASLKELGCASLTRLEAGMEEENTITAGGWGDTGYWYIYAVVDPATASDKTDGIEGDIDEKGVDPQTPQQEENNWHFIEAIEVGKGVDLNLGMSIPGSGSGMPHYRVGQTFNIDVMVSNMNTTHEINGLSVYLPLPAQLSVIGGSGYNAPYFSNVSVPANGSVTLTVTVKVNSASNPPVAIRAEIHESHLPQNYYEFDDTWPIWAEQRVKLQRSDDDD